MKNLISFRNLENKDIRDVLKIYNYHIINGQSNFEEKKITYRNFLKLCTNIQKEGLPFIVCLKSEKLIGFSYLSKFRSKSGYRFSFENSVYVDSKHIGFGIGTKLLKKLIQSSLKNKNIKTIIAVIANNSIASVKIHEKNGFKNIGIIREVGFKNNKWLDAIYLQKILY